MAARNKKVNIAEFRQLYPTTKSEVLAAKYGISLTGVRQYAHRLNILKTDSFRSEQNRLNAHSGYQKRRNL